MAVKTVLIDDITGEEGAKTRAFALAGEEYEIDLVDSTYEELEKALAGFIESARKIRGAKRSHHASPAKKATPAVSKTDQLGAIRDWARKEGKKVSDRGRIPKDIVDAFEEAHGPTFSHAG
ncbi:Lsr2-like DNA bridging protein [Mycobacterium phage LittleE]|uniref:Lsr2-like DNA bridging protein n=1 Tax=Mycobacterium phage LittleE TaxID=2922212 RepID=G1D3U4_9CAUD|nr:nucloid associated Lsr2-like [Mycobacterium phage LittleE]AEK09442.1 Lsr2-like DNA bridging protein [Mycobacterium phage LittleE]